MSLTWWCLHTIFTAMTYGSNTDAKKQSWPWVCHKNSSFAAKFSVQSPQSPQFVYFNNTRETVCILEAQRKTRVLKKMSLFQGWQLNSRNVISNLSCTNILICVQLTGQVCPWLKGKENGSKIPLQEGGGGWKYLWRATRHETAWEHPI